MLTRIYIVSSGDEKRLVEAGSAAQAIRHVVMPKYTSKAATPKDIANIMAAGGHVEQANVDYSLIPAQAVTEQPTHTPQTN